ncbi:MAG: peptide deformylase [Pseudomonadales bacterium]|nr:peptide deformylase [Pseudomonadales bacterium]
MTVLRIIRMGHPTLRKVAEPYPVEKIGTPEFRQMVADLKETMYAANGIGLAAPQVNLGWQVAVIEIPETPTRYGEVPALPFAAYINPKITVLEDDRAGYWEGCLSVPGMMGYVERPQKIQVDYVDEGGNQKSLIAEGFTATVFQHEFDHLYGTLYVDRIEDPALFMYEEEYRQFHEGDAPELDEA